LASYPSHSRGGQGVRTFRVSDKAGKVAAARVVTDAPDQLILIISSKAQVVRITLEDVRVTGRNTQGVIVWRDREPDDYVASIACFQQSDTQDSEGDEEPKNGKKAPKAKAKASKSSVEEDVEPEDIEENEDELTTDDVEETDASQEDDQESEDDDDADDGAEDEAEDEDDEVEESSTE
jgi:DNA gyrase subunit A